MIVIEKIRIEKFRGIRELDLDLRRENFGICGPNGTGKSGVVDAIEFALTGDVSRLSGRGTGDLSVKAHAPHVKERAEPEQALVHLSLHIPSTGQSAVITRTAATPSVCTLTPDDPDIRNIIEEVQVHPEFALSRREIIRYILAEPNNRAADVQELLRLSEVEATRKALTTVTNEVRKQHDTAEQTRNRTRATLLQTLDVEKPETSAILGIVNTKRAVLALAPLEKLEPNTSFKQGAPEAQERTATPIKKAQFKADLEKLAQYATQGQDEQTKVKRAAARNDLDGLSKDATALRTLKQQSLIKSGLELIDNNACPLCDTEWERQTLIDHLTTKLESAEQAGKLLSTLNANLNYVIGELEAYAALAQHIINASVKLEPALDTNVLVQHKDEAAQAAKDLASFVSETSNIDVALQALDFDWWTLPKGATKDLQTCLTAADALPDVSDEDKAREFLTLAEEQYRRAVEARRELAAAQNKLKTAERVLEVYQAQSDGILESLYEEVAKDFTAYYRSLNSEDEGEFVGQLVPSAAKLGFDVDFYGYGRFPPGAYHSEGHQDGMGLCLYLALMKRTLGDKFTFSVLDDVLMSVDADHRREVCRLLKREFPSTQFILTTHDRVWLKFMHTEGLIKNSQTFSSWSVESGPQVWQNRDLWADIESALDSNDVELAAAHLRRFLEYISSVLADSFRAEVRFKGDGQYTLEDLMPSVFNRWRKKVADAVKVAKSWDKQERAELISQLLAKIDDAKERTQAERWAINANIHYNAWANFQPDEFRQVAQAFADMLETMRCGYCDGYVEFEPRHGAVETIRCKCGEFFLNLKKKDT